METLKNGYKKDIDYTLQYNTKQHSNQNRYVKVMLTVPTFKRLCMRSRSKNAELVRTYFIELDDFIGRYSDQISDGIVKDIKQIAKNMEKYPNKDGPGYIYAIQASKERSGLIKIGYASDLIKRLSVYNVGRAEDVVLLHSIRVKYRKQVDACLKSFMDAKRYKKRKEIYEVDLDIIKKLIKGCDKLSMDVHSLNPVKEEKQDGKYYVLFMDKNGGTLHDLLENRM